MGRIIIYGAGAIGGTVGGHLARTGSTVVLIGHQRHVQAIQEHGLRFVTPNGTSILHLPAVTGPAQIGVVPGDVVFLCMKGQDTEAALHDLKAAVDDVPVFCFQNGVRNEEIASRYFRQVYGVMVSIGGIYLTEGEVMCRRDPPGSVAIGCYPTGDDELAHRVGEQLRQAGFTVLVTADVMRYKWGKLLGNLANAINAVTNGQDPDGRIAQAVRNEARSLMTQAGISWTTWEEALRQSPELRAPIVAELPREAYGSTWQSLTRREGSVETDFLNGEIVRLARRLGTEAPVNAALQRVVEEMAVRGDTPGKYSADQLASLLGLKT
jgi:2-dehydropantoate 2-reductase